MKGILRKTDNGWVVREYDGKKPAYKELPLHPEDEKYAEEGKEIEFFVPLGSGVAELVVEEDTEQGTALKIVKQQEVWNEIVNGKNHYPTLPRQESTEEIFRKEPVTFLLVNALRLDQDKQRQLADALYERLPKQEESWDKFFDVLDNMNRDAHKEYVKENYLPPVRKK